MRQFVQRNPMKITANIFLKLDELSTRRTLRPKWTTIHTQQTSIRPYGFPDRSYHFQHTHFRWFSPEPKTASRPHSTFYKPGVVKLLLCLAHKLIRNILLACHFPYRCRPLFTMPRQIHHSRQCIIRVVPQKVHLQSNT